MHNLPAKTCAAKEIVADGAYDSEEIRASLSGAGFNTTILSKRNRKHATPHDKRGYEDRNRAERLVRRLKRMRRVSICYEKLASAFLPLIHLSCIASIMM